MDINNNKGVENSDWPFFSDLPPKKTELSMPEASAISEVQAQEEFLPTVDNFIELIHKSGLTEICIQDLCNFPQMVELKESFQAIYGNSGTDKIVLDLLLQEIFDEKNKEHLTTIFSLYAWDYVYYKGHLPDTQKDCLQSFIGYPHFYNLIDTLPDSLERKELHKSSFLSLDDYIKFIFDTKSLGLETTVKGYEKMSYAQKLLVKCIFEQGLDIINKDAKKSCRDTLYSFFDESVSLENCLNLTSYMDTHSRFQCHLSFYLRVLRDKQRNEDIFPPIPDLSLIKNEEARALIKNIELNIRELPLEIPNYPKKRKELEGVNAVQLNTKKPRVNYPVSIATLVDLMHEHRCFDECIKTLSEIDDFKEIIEATTLSLDDDAQKDIKLMEAIFEMVFDNSSPEFLTELISYFAWNLLYEKGCLPAKNGDPLLDFLGYSHPFELILNKPKKSDSKDFSDYQQNRKTSYFDLEAYTDFVLLSGKRNKICENEVEKKLFEVALGRTDEELVEDDAGIFCEEMLYGFFGGKRGMNICQALFKFTTNEENDWITKTSYYFAQYLRILTAQQQNGSLPSMPDLSSIKNKPQYPLINNIERWVRGMELDLPEEILSKMSDEDEIPDLESMWTVFHDDKVIEFKKNVLNPIANIKNINDFKINVLEEDKDVLDYECSSTSNVIEIASVVKVSKENYPPTLDNLVYIILTNNLYHSFMGEMRDVENVEIRNFIKKYEELYQYSPDKEKLILKAVCEEIFCDPSHLAEIISLFTWRYVYTNGCLSKNSNDLLLSFLGYENFFDFIKAAPDSSKLEEKHAGPYYTLEEYSKFALEGDVKGYHTMSIEKKAIADMVLSKLDGQLKEDKRTSCEELLACFFIGKFHEHEYESLVAYMEEGEGWLGEHSYHLALYLKILQQQRKNGTLPLSMPDFSFIKNHGARNLITKIEREIRLGYFGEIRKNSPTLNREITPLSSKNMKNLIHSKIFFSSKNSLPLNCIPPTLYCTEPKSDFYETALREALSMSSKTQFFGASREINISRTGSTQMNGIINGGNTCYISSVCWALIHTFQEIKEYKASEENDDPKIKEIQEKFQDLVKDLLSTTTKTIDAKTINSFRLMIQKAFPHAFEHMLQNHKEKVRKKIMKLFKSYLQGVMSVDKIKQYMEISPKTFQDAFDNLQNQMMGYDPQAVFNIEIANKKIQELLKNSVEYFSTTTSAALKNEMKTEFDVAFKNKPLVPSNEGLKKLPKGGDEQEDAAPFLTCLIDDVLCLPAFKNDQCSFQTRRYLKEPAAAFEDRDRYHYKKAFGLSMDEKDHGSMMNIQMGEFSNKEVSLKNLMTDQKKEMRDIHVYLKEKPTEGLNKYRKVEVECQEQIVVTSKETAPPYLIGHLARFTYGLVAAKRVDPVLLSEELEFSIFPDKEAKEETGKVGYEIKAVVVHLGQSSAVGHYVTYCKEDDQWVLYNDIEGISVCSKEDAEKQIACNGYLFFYKKK